MIMKRHGTMLNVFFRYEGWDIRELAYRYKLIHQEYDKTAIVHVTSMKELKQEVQKFINGAYNEES